MTKGEAIRIVETLLRIDIERCGNSYITSVDVVAIKRLLQEVKSNGSRGPVGKEFW